MSKRPVTELNFKPFGAAIKAARVAHKESRKQASEAFSISPRYLANIENVGQQPSLPLFFDMVKRYNISVDQFILPDVVVEKSVQRQQLDAMLNQMDEPALYILLSTADGILSASKMKESEEKMQSENGDRVWHCPR